MFEDPDSPESPYWQSGTCFLFRYGTGFYLATATHVLDGCRAEDLRVHAREDYTDESLPFERRIEGMASATIPEAAADFVLLRIAARHCSEEQLAIVGSLDLSLLRPARKFRPGDPMLLTGYPFAKKFIDYNRRTFTNQRVITDGEYRGSSPDETTMHLGLQRIDGIQHLGGFCGSPVFAVRAEGTSYQPICLAGMVIQQATIKDAPSLPWEVRFISASVIFSALDKAEARWPR
jgi:hypothetical protein